MPDQHGYSTLEVDPRFLREQGLPEVDDGRLPQVRPFDGLHVDDRLKVPLASDVWPGPPPFCGLRRRTFWIVVVVGVLAVLGTMAGAIAGTRRTGTGTANGNDTVPTALFAGTRLASANFTDSLGWDSYIVVYQLNNRAIYMSTYNSSRAKWVVSPVVDGSNVRLGTSLSVSALGQRDGAFIYVASWLAANGHQSADVLVLWQTADDDVDGLQRSVQTDTPGNASWNTPFSRLRAAPQSPIVSYRRQCDGCVRDSFIMVQGPQADLPLSGYRAAEKTLTWSPTSFGKKLAQNTSMALASVPAGSQPASLHFFYRTPAGLLSWLRYDGNQTSGRDLLRELGPRISIAAFSSVGSGDDPLRLLVLTADSGDYVKLARYGRGDWILDDRKPVKALGSCAAWASLAANAAQRVYCVVTALGGVEAVEWKWGLVRSDASPDEGAFSSMGTVNTIVSSP